MNTSASRSRPLAEKPTRSGYGERVVALVDVLGASAALNTPATSRRFAEALAAILSPIVRGTHQEPWLVLPHVHTGEAVEIEHERPITKGSRITTISDSIVISVPCESRLPPEERLLRIFDCMRAVSTLQRSLLTLGLRTRGGLALGGLIHKDHLVVGDALVRVHQMESVEAKMPRVLIDSPVIDLLLKGPFPPGLALFQNRIAHAVRQDEDEAYFIDYLATDPITGSFNLYHYLLEIWTSTQAEAATQSDEKIRLKLDWMIGYFERVLSEYWLTYPKVCHAGTRFSSVFPRTADNLKTWSESIIYARVKDSESPGIEPEVATGR